MRVATRSFYQSIQERILRLTDDLKRINERVSSGKNLHRPSDDPLALIDALHLKAGLSQIEQYQRNMERGESWLNLTESVLSQALQLVDRAQELAVQMSNDTQSAETRGYAAIEVGHLLDQAISLGNTQLGGSYIFSGYQTRTVPFTKVNLGGIETAQYHGDGNDFKILIGREEELTVGRNGQSVWIGSDLFNTLGRLKKALEDNDPNGIRQEIEPLRRLQDSLNHEVGDIGARANRLEGKKEILNHLELNLRDRLSLREDADYAKVIVELREKELAYQAALLSSTRIAELTILNYIR